MAPAAIPTRLKANAPKDSLRVLANLFLDLEAETFSKFLKNLRRVVMNVGVMDS